MAVSAILVLFLHDQSFLRKVPQNSALLRTSKAGYGQIPLAFEANQGQTDPSVRFLALGNGYSLFLTPTQAVWALRDRPRRTRSRSASRTSPEKTDYLWMSLKGADPRCRAEGLGELPGKSNYLVGQDPSRYKTNTPQFAKVKFTGVYPHIDLFYYGSTGGKLEYDFVLQPHARPEDIRLQFRGAKKLWLRDDGSLEVAMGLKKMSFQLPAVYQSGTQGRETLKGRFVLRSGNEVGFEVAGYDPSRPLVIDPTFTLVYSTYIGSTAAYFHNELADFCVDPSGFTYLVEPGPGGFPYPTTSGAFQTTDKGTINAIIVKLNQAGSALVYATYLGGSVEDQCFSIAADAGGNAYLTGFAGSSDFPTTPGAYRAGPPVGPDAFVAKLNPTGTALVYSTLLGGSSQDVGRSIVVDSDGDAYVGGYTQSTDFPTTSGAFMTTKPSGSQSLFVTKVNPTGTALVYSTYLGGSGNDQLDALAIDGSGDAYVTGITSSTDFPTTSGAYRTTASGSSDAFVTKLNPTGTALAYSTYLGGSQQDEGQAIAVDASGSAYVTGYTASADFPTTPGVLGLSLTGTENCFVTKLSPAGNSLVFSTYLGGKTVDLGYGITVDGSGQVYVGGLTGSSDFPTTPGALKTTFISSTTFFSLLNPTATSLLYSTFWGGSGGEDDGARIGLDSSGAVYLGGGTYTSDYPTTAGAYETTHAADSEDLFVAKLVMGITNSPTATNSPSPTPTLSSTATPTSTGNATNTPTFTLTSTFTSSITDTPTPTGSWTSTPTVTETFTPTGSYTLTFTQTPTATLTPTPTNTPALTFTPTGTSTLGSSSFGFCPPYPNPSDGSSPVSFCVDVPEGSLVDLGIYTTAFRKIYGRHPTLSGQNFLNWNLRDDWGTPAANGVYYLKIQVTGIQPVTKIFKILVIR